MAENKQSIVYEFTMETAELVKNIEVAKQELQDLKKAEKDLNKQRDEGIVTGDAYIKKLSELKVAQEQQKVVIKSNTDVLKANAKQMTATNGSLEQMRGQLRKLQIEYDNLSEAERKSAKGEEMKHKLEVLNNDIKGVEMSTGRFGRNVGNYLNSIKSAFADAGGASAKLAGGVAGITTKVKALTAIPIIALINGIIFVIQKVIGALKSSEGSFNRVRVAMSGMKGIGDLVTRMLQGLGKGIAWVAEKLSVLLDKLNIVNEATKKRKELTERQIALEKREREVIVENSELMLESERMRQKATAKDIYSNKERLEFLEKAKDLELEISKNNIDLAKRRYDIIKDTNALTDSSTEDLLEESRAQAAINDAQREYESRLKELNSQIVEAKNAILAENAVAVKALQDQGAEIDIILGKMPQLTQDLNDAFQEMASGGMQEYVDEMKSQLDGLNDYWWEQIELEEEYAQMEVDIQQQKALAIGSIFGSLSALTAKFGEKNEKLAKASKVLAVAQVAIEGGIAIAKATKSGADLGIPGIIATVATATTNLALAIASIASAKFATGGYVQGAGTGTSDSIPARLSNGESVINARSTRKYYHLLSAINQDGGGVAFGGEGGGNKFANGGVINYDTLASGRAGADLDQIAQAIAKVQPVVSVREITRVQNRVKTKEDR